MSCRLRRSAQITFSPLRQLNLGDALEISSSDRTNAVGPNLVLIGDPMIPPSTVDIAKKHTISLPGDGPRLNVIGDAKTIKLDGAATNGAFALIEQNNLLGNRVPSTSTGMRITLLCL